MSMASGSLREMGKQAGLKVQEKKWARPRQVQGFSRLLAKSCGYLLQDSFLAAEGKTKAFQEGTKILNRLKVKK